MRIKSLSALGACFKRNYTRAHFFYRITIHVSEGDRDESEHFQGEAFSATDVHVEGVSDEEKAKNGSLDLLYDPCWASCHPVSSAALYVRSSQQQD